MNLNELFFFKVFECIKESNNKINKFNHNEKNCYFHHTSVHNENDKRREQISFTAFFKKLKTYMEEGNIILNLETVFEFKNNGNDLSLNYYTNKPSFQNYNNYIYNQFDCCKNETEYLYHIKNYKKTKCKYYSINKVCKKKYCDKIHPNVKNEEENNINYLRKIIDSWIERKEIKLREIIETFNKILSYENKNLSKIQLNEIKRDFEPFLKFYNDNKNSKNIMNINNYQNFDKKISQRIMQQIHRNLNQNNKKNKIYKNSDLFHSLSISDSICYLSPSDSIKSNEIIKYIYAFLNSNDGKIIFGGRFFKDSYIINGIRIKQKEREKFEKWFNSEFLKILIEYEDYIKYQYYDLANNNNEECILVIDVKQIKTNKFLMTSSKKKFVIKEDINKKLEKNIILDEQAFVELDTKQYIDLLRRRFIKYYSEKLGINKLINTNI